MQDEALRAGLQAFGSVSGVHPGEGAGADVLSVGEAAVGGAESEGGGDKAQRSVVGSIEGDFVEAGGDGGDAGGGFDGLEGAEVKQGVAKEVEGIVLHHGKGELGDGGDGGQLEVAQGDVGEGVGTRAAGEDGGRQPSLIR